MSYTIAKENIGTPRTFKTEGALERALARAGAKGVEIHQNFVRVDWPEGEVRYRMDPEGNIDQQLAWDIEG